jgi:hypothetical protein
LWESNPLKIFHNKILLTNLKVAVAVPLLYDIIIS